MFSKGQLIFALVFFIGFVIAIVVAFMKDKKGNGSYFKGSYKILIGFLIFIALLFVIKIFFKH